jgi:hypothetical protein
LSTLLQDILHPSHRLLNVLLQIANKLGLSNNNKNFLTVDVKDTFHGTATSSDFPGSGTELKPQFLPTTPQDVCLSVASADVFDNDD